MITESCPRHQDSLQLIIRQHPENTHKTGLAIGDQSNCQQPCPLNRHKTVTTVIETIIIVKITAHILRTQILLAISLI